METETTQTAQSTETTQASQTAATEQAVSTENAAPGTETNQTQGNDTKPEKTFTQKELDDIISKRLDRERETVSKKAAQEARDTWIAEQGYTWNGKPIKTEAEYNEAVREQELREKYKELPEDVQQELIESKKFREQYESDKKSSADKAKRDADFQAFLEAFPDVKAEDIPTSVWEDVSKGKSLVDAFTRHENALLRQKLAEIEKGKETEQQNAENASSSTGSVTGQGAAQATQRFTREQVAKMSREEVKKNWTAINESMKTWE